MYSVVEARVTGAWLRGEERGLSVIEEREGAREWEVPRRVDAGWGFEEIGASKLMP
jgi:hypothetical protein